MGIGCAELIRDLNTIKYSTNPYNVNRMTMAAGIAAMEENQYYLDNCKRIIETREATARSLTERGFTVLPSCTNFLFARHESIPGEAIYQGLRERGVLVRHFSKPRISAFNRITIGTPEQMEQFLAALDDTVSSYEAKERTE